MDKNYYDQVRGSVNLNYRKPGLVPVSDSASFFGNQVTQKFKKQLLYSNKGGLKNLNGGTRNRILNQSVDFAQIN